MPGIGDQRGRVDAPAHHQLVPGHYLVTDDAQHRIGDPRADMRRVAMLRQLADALPAGEHCAGPDHHGNPDSGQVLGPLQAVWVTLSGRPPRQPEPRNTTALVETSDRL
jgi:hypothetical protein